VLFIFIFVEINPFSLNMVDTSLKKQLIVIIVVTLQTPRK